MTTGMSAPPTGNTSPRSHRCHRARFASRSIRGLAAEVVALDSGSTDGTIPLLRSHGVTIVDQPWLGFVRQKRAALDRCSQPWALHLDSDESLEPRLRESIERALSHDDPAVVGYEVNRKVWYAGRFLEHAWQPEWRLRLVRRGAARWAGEDPHDSMEIIARGGRVGRLAGDLRHVIGRLWDLLPVIQEQYYHPGFLGSYSIKAVLPAVLPELGYDDLEIQDGGLAAQAYARMVFVETDWVERERLREALLRYCARDTLAMLELRRTLLGKASRAARCADR